MIGIYTNNNYEKYAMEENCNLKKNISFLKEKYQENLSYKWKP